MDKPCKFASNPSGDIWECTCYRSTYCADQIFIDDAPSIDIVQCEGGKVCVKFREAEGA